VKRFVKFIGMALAGAVVMVLCLAWVAQFFRGGGESTPVIWIEELGSQSRGKPEESFGEFEGEESR
jgi:hypothetical protein